MWTELFFHLRLNLEDVWEEAEADLLVVFAAKFIHSILTSHRHCTKQQGKQHYVNVQNLIKVIDFIWIKFNIFSEILLSMNESPSTEFK